MQRKALPNIGLLLLKSAGAGVVLILLSATVVSQTLAITDSPSKETYQRNLDSYRVSYNKYMVKSNEYHQFGTFASEEALVSSARDMLTARADVWQTYWQLLTTTVNGLQQLPQERKTALTQKLTAETDWLTAHKNRLAAAKTKSVLNAEAMALNKKSDAMGAMAYGINADISITYLRQSAQSLLNFNRQLSERVNADRLTTGDKETVLRGLTVNAERITEDMNKLSAFETQFGTTATGLSSVNSFVQITQGVSPVYVDLSQQLHVVTELSTGVVW